MTLKNRLTDLFKKEEKKTKKASRFKLGSKSRRALNGVHPDLVRVVERAITLTKKDFTVIEGLRTRERQRELVRRGASRTMNSRHLTGHAVDITPYPISWDWDDGYYDIADAMKEAARLEGVEIEWGGDWRTFKDGPHWQLPRSAYPT